MAMPVAPDDSSATIGVPNRLWKSAKPGSLEQKRLVEWMPSVLPSCIAANPK
jgi:hypothetical protein